MYFYPINTKTTQLFHSTMEEMSQKDFIRSDSDDGDLTITNNSKNDGRSLSLLVYGHQFDVPFVFSGRRVAKFSFSDLCSKAYGAADYIDLAQIFNVVGIFDVPRLEISNRNEVSSTFIP